MLTALSILSALAWAAVLAVTGPALWRVMAGRAEYPDPLRAVFFLLALNRVFYGGLDVIDPRFADEPYYDARLALRLFSILLAGLVLYILHKYERAGP